MCSNDIDEEKIFFNEITNNLINSGNKFIEIDKSSGLYIKFDNDKELECFLDKNKSGACFSFKTKEKITSLFCISPIACKALYCMLKKILPELYGDIKK